MFLTNPCGGQNTSNKNTTKLMTHITADICRMANMFGMPNRFGSTCLIFMGLCTYLASQCSIKPDSLHCSIFSLNIRVKNEFFRM